MDISPKKTSRGPTHTHKKMPNITYHHGNTNRNYNGVPPHTSQNGENQRHKKQQVLVSMWRKRNPLSLLVGIQIGVVIVENGMEAPQKIKNRTTLSSSNHTTGYLPKNLQKHKFRGILAPLCLLQHYLQ